MEKTDTSIKILSYNPVGIKKRCYPMKYCTLCRGELTDACSICLDNGNNKKLCTVKCINITSENNTTEILYYHTHCYNLISEVTK